MKLVTRNSIKFRIIKHNAKDEEFGGSTDGLFLIGHM